MSDIEKLEQPFWQRIVDGEMERTSFRPEDDDWTEMVALAWRLGDRVAQLDVTAEAYAHEGVRRVAHEALERMLEE
jgi:hypothetical protein